MLLFLSWARSGLHAWTGAFDGNPFNGWPGPLVSFHELLDAEANKHIIR